MPIYNFVCQKCQNSFSLEATFEEYDKKEPKKFCCPKCGSKKIKQTFGNIFFVKNGSGKNSIRCNCGS